MQDEKRKQYMDKYNKKKLEHYNQLSDGDSRRKRKFTVKGERCGRCEKLLSKAGQGDGIICSECIDYQTNGPKPYFSQTKGLY